MKTTFRLLKITTIILTAGIFVACESDDDDDNDGGNPQELITDVEITLTNPDTQTSQTFTFSDPDGPGGNAPTIDTIVLNTGGENTIYNAAVRVLDASDPNDVEDISIEVFNEGDEHQFFYIPNAEADTALTVTYDPSAPADVNGNPIGLRSQWVTFGATPTGSNIRVVLRHEPNKGAAGVSLGDITNAGGESDVDVVFPLIVQ